MKPLASPPPSAPDQALNAFQRWALARADAGRQHWPAEQRQQAWLLDRHLVGKAGLGMGAGILGGGSGMAISLHGAGAGWGWAGGLSLVFLLSVLLGARHAWLRPERFGARRLLRLAALMMLATYASTLALTWRRSRGAEAGWPAWSDWPGLLWQATPLQLSLGLAGLFMVWLVGSTRRRLLEEELAWLKLRQERDTAARTATEAQLRLLQAQIQPHFIFNTLAALQHWVDSSDPRAPGLLRALTSFLRASTETLAREQIPLAEEAATVAHYLAIQQARLGPRLRSAQALPPEAGALTLPPGLLLTLVENAIEHGISPSLAGGEIRLGGARLGQGQGPDERAGWALWVDNTGQPLPQPLPPEGVGLRNCRERLLRLAGPHATLALQRQPDGSTRAALWLPQAA